jgi:polysaccharide export outer membrane protein
MKMIRRLMLPSCFGLLLAATPIAAATSGFAAETGLAPNTRTRAATSQPDHSSLSYRLGPNDRIRLKVYGEQDVSGDYEVDGSGYVSVPLAGRVRAAGLTTRQLERAIASALAKGMLRDPRVNVEVAAYRPFYILGEVKRAGEYPYKSGLTVLDAVASAGGYTYRANESKVAIRRAGSAVEDIYPLDVPVLVYPGDNIRIPERYF